MSKEKGKDTGYDYWGYNPETGEYDKRFETEGAYHEWYKENYESDEKDED